MTRRAVCAWGDIKSKMPRQGVPYLFTQTGIGEVADWRECVADT